MVRKSINRAAIILPAMGLCAFASSAALGCSPSQVQDLFAYEAQTQSILDVEAAMARAQAAHGVIPQEAADDISVKADVALIPQAEFDEEYEHVRHRMVALLNVWRRSLDPAGDQFVHYGATTVDIYGTATIIQIEQTLNELDNCLASSIDTMSQLAADHAQTPMIGRTLGQHAQPITFGKKVSVWIDEYSRHRERLDGVKSRLRRSAILKGAVGNYSGLGDQAIAVEQSFAEELGFDPPYAADWSGARDVIAEFGLILGLIARSHQRIGQELFLLQGTDIGEVREQQRPGVVGSSSMPHKRNPRAPERLIHSGRTIPRLAEVLSDDVVNLFERDNTSRLTPVVEEISVESVRAVGTLNTLLAGLEIDTQRMRENIDLTRGFAMSQRVAFSLSEHMPRQEAEALVKQIIATAMTQNATFLDVLLADSRVTEHLNREELVDLLAPERIETPAIDQIERAIADAAIEEGSTQ